MVRENVDMKLVVIIYRLLSAAGRVDTLRPACIIHGIKIYVILDLGVTLEFIDSKFVRYYGLLHLLIKKAKKEILIVVDGHT